jgi:hypothetical protein
MPDYSIIGCVLSGRVVKKPGVDLGHQSGLSESPFVRYSRHPSHTAIELSRRKTSIGWLCVQPDIYSCHFNSIKKTIHRHREYIVLLDTLRKHCLMIVEISAIVG